MRGYQRYAQLFPFTRSKLQTTFHHSALIISRFTAAVQTSNAKEHVHSFTAPLLPDWPSSQLFQHVQINHQANSLKSMLLSLFLTGLKRQVAEKDWGRYIVSGGAWSQFDVSVMRNFGSPLNVSPLACLGSEDRVPGSRD